MRGGASLPVPFCCWLPSCGKGGRKPTGTFAAFFFCFFFFLFPSTLKEQLPVLSSGSRASTPLKKEADSIRAKLEELGEDAAEVCLCVFYSTFFSLKVRQQGRVTMPSV